MNPHGIVLAATLALLLACHALVGVAHAAVGDLPSTLQANTIAAKGSDKLMGWLEEAGFEGQALRVAWAVAMRESSGDPTLGPGHPEYNGYDMGLFQWNRPSWSDESWWDEKRLLEPVYNAKIAFKISKGGTWWLPWGLSGDGKTMDASYYPMWSAEKRQSWIWDNYKKWYDQYPGDTASGDDSVVDKGKDKDKDKKPGKDLGKDSLLPAEGEIGQVEGPRGAVNIRMGPGGKVERRAPNGTPVKFTGRKEGRWLEVEIEGKVRWIRARKFQPPKEELPPPDGGGVAGDPDPGTTPGAGKDKERGDKPAGGKGFDKDGLLKVPERSQYGAEVPAHLKDSMCGPTSVAMALQFYGVKKSVLEVARECQSINSSNQFTATYIGNLHAALVKNGFKGSELKEGAGIKWLEKTVESGKPVLVNVDTIWPGGHYMVCTGIKDGKVYVNDPGRSEVARSFSMSEFLPCWQSRSCRAIAVSR